MTAIAAAIAHGVWRSVARPSVSRVAVEDQRPEEERQVHQREEEQLARPPRPRVRPRAGDTAPQEGGAEHQRAREVSTAGHAERYEEQRDRDQGDDVADDV